MAPTRDPGHVRRAEARRRSGWTSGGVAVAVLAAGVLVPAGYACAVYGVDAVSAAVGRRVVVAAAYAVLLVAAAVLLRGLLLIGGGGGGGDVRVAVGAVLFGIVVPVLVNVVLLLGGDLAARDVTALDGYLVVAAIGGLVMAVVLSVRLRIALAREDTGG